MNADKRFALLNLMRGVKAVGIVQSENTTKKALDSGSLI